MLFAVGAAAGAVDILKSLTSSPASKPADGSGFQVASSASGTADAKTVAAAPTQSGNLSSDTMSALLDAQGSSADVAPSRPAHRSKALKDLLALLDSNNDGAISKNEFEDALGAGGTNVANADGVFDKLDKDNNGSVGLDESSTALKSRRPPPLNAMASPYAFANPASIHSTGSTLSLSA